MPTISGLANNSDVSLHGGSVVLTCHADGHPPPIYRWLDFSSGEARSKYTISAAGLYRLECTASNGNTFAHLLTAASYHRVCLHGSTPTVCVSVYLFCAHFTMCAFVHTVCTSQDHFDPQCKLILNLMIILACETVADCLLHLYFYCIISFLFFEFHKIQCLPF